MGCYEVSLGDTMGTGNPTSVEEMLSAALGANPVERLAGHVRSLIICRLTIHSTKDIAHMPHFSSMIRLAWE